MLGKVGAVCVSVASAQIQPCAKLTCLIYIVMLGNEPYDQNHQAIQQCRPNNCLRCPHQGKHLEHHHVSTAIQWSWIQSLL